MHVQEHSELYEDSVKAILAKNFLEDIDQVYDDTLTKIEAGSLQTICTAIQVADTGDIAIVPLSVASICTFAIMAESEMVQFLDVRSGAEKIVGEDDFSDEYPLAIEVKHGKQEDDKETLYQELYKIYRECSESDWDNDGANPVNEQTFLEAITLLGKLPPELPLPEVMPEPTGNIAFEWYKGKRNVYVISVCGKGTIEYAGLFGRHSKTYGTEYFLRELPELIMSHILRLFI